MPWGAAISDLIRFGKECEGRFESTTGGMTHGISTMVDGLADHICPHLYLTSVRRARPLDYDPSRGVLREIKLPHLRMVNGVLGIPNRQVTPGYK